MSDFRPAPKPSRGVKPKRSWMQEAYRKIARPAYFAGVAAGQGRVKALCERCGCRAATQLHHKAGRSGDRLLGFRNFSALCGSCHREVHANPERSYAEGWLVKRSLESVEDADDLAAEGGAASS